MTTTIYYFSGTGNSLHVARQIAKLNSDSKLVNIAGLSGTPEISDSSDVIGLVFPTHFGDLPSIVKQFTGKLKLAGKPYIFAIATSGVMPGNVLSSLDRRLKEKEIRLSAGFTLTMPDNAYVKVNMITPPGQREAMLQAAEAGLEKIALAVSRKEPAPTGKSALSASLMSGFMKAYCGNFQKGFFATGSCSGCGTCVMICPSGNIEASGKQVKWGNNCLQCLACFHWCPKQAIQLDSKTAAIMRYHHPEIIVNDMMVREK